MREVKPTQKPVPSSDIKDLFFNSGLLDIWATSLERKYIDRFGNCHLTAAGMEWLFKELVEKFKVDMNIAIVAAGYITIDSFQQGADLPNNELTQRNHILRDETTGEYYRWDGDLPKQVPAGSTPQSTGGIGNGAWVSVGDASLRGDLSEFNTTASEISARTASISRSFLEFGATGLGLADDYIALQAAIDWAGSKKGRRVYGRAGDKYRISKGLILKFDGKFLDKSSACTLDFTGTELIPAFENDTALKVSRNYATVIQPEVSNEGGYANVTAYAVAPEDETQTTQKVTQMFCVFHQPVASNCHTGFRFRPGATVNNQDSGSFYHDVYSPLFDNCNIGFHFARSLTGRILTTRVNIYSPKHINGHCAWDIEAADSLTVYGGSAEFINKTGIHTGNPTIKVHKPVADDALESTNIMFLRFFGEVGTTPFDLSKATNQVSFPSCTFYGYENEGINNTFPQQNTLANEGAVVSRAAVSSNSRAMLAVRREVGANKGQAYLSLGSVQGSAAELYSDTGFEFKSVVTKLPVLDIQNKTSNSQIIGTAFSRAEITGNQTNGTMIFYNTSALTGRSFEFGGVFRVAPNTDSATSLGAPEKRWTNIFAQNGSINTSDERLKTRPISISDKILDAWAEVDYVAYQWVDSVVEKGDSARIHFGVIAQHVRDVFDRHGIDATQLGLLCYDEWSGEDAIVSEDSNEVVSEKLEAGNRWGIRYDQCMILESALMRRELGRLKGDKRDTKSL